MSVKYHVNPDTGEVGVCSAEIKCAFDDIGAEHFTDKGKAETAGAEILEKKHGIVSIFSKKKRDLSEEQPEFKKLKVSLPFLEGTVVRIWNGDPDDGKLYTLKKGMWVENENPRNAYGIPDMNSYDLVDGPKGYMFDDQQRVIKSQKQLQAARVEFHEESLKVEEAIVGDDPDLTMVMMRRQADDGETESVIEITGWDWDEDDETVEKFRFRITESGDKDGDGNERGFPIEGKGDTRSKHATEVLGRIANVTNYNNLFRSRERVDYETRQFNGLVDNLTEKIQKASSKNK